MASLSSLLASSQSLNYDLSRAELPQVNLSLDQIEAQSRRLVARQHQNQQNNADYLLAQAQINTTALSNSIAQLGATAASTFTPLQALQDTDVKGYLRAAHEQTLISTIEESRKETMRDFYQMLGDRMNKDWENMKARIYDQQTPSTSRRPTNITAGPTVVPSLQMQTKMMAYDRVITDLNQSRLKSLNFPILNALRNAESSISNEPSSFTAILETLIYITDEPPAFPEMSHPNANILNMPMNQGKFKNATGLHKTITQGSLAYLEAHYQTIINSTLNTHAAEARLGGDPTIQNRVRSFVSLRYYRQGEWFPGIELVAGKPIWAWTFFLIRTGHLSQALETLQEHESAVERHEPGFIGFLNTWVKGGRTVPKNLVSHIQATYNAHMLRGKGDPFKLGLYKLMGQLDRQHRSVEALTNTIEDWMWFQLGMVDLSPESTDLQTLTDLVLSFGEQHFDPPGSSTARKWPHILSLCGAFERAIAALHSSPASQPEAVHLGIACAYYGLLKLPSSKVEQSEGILTLSPLTGASINYSVMIWRYIRQFVKMDPKEGLQYVYSITLLGTKPEILEEGYELVRRIIVMANQTGPGWDELVGGYRPDGSKFMGLIEQNASLLSLSNEGAYSKEIILPTAESCLQNSQIPASIKLYNLAGEYNTVISVLASALGTLVLQTSAPGVAGGVTLDEASVQLEKTAREILRHYERTNRAHGKEREAVEVLLRIREAVEARKAGRFDVVLEMMESINLIPLDNDVSKITRRAEEFRDLHESIQRNLPTYVTLTMDAIAGLHANLKHGMVMLSDATRSTTLQELRKKSRSVMVFAGMLKYRMSPDVYSYLARLDVEIAL